MCLLLIAIFAIIITLFALRCLYFDKLRVDDIDKKAILITGSGAGFGHALVLKCLENEMTVFGACRTKESAEKLKKECEHMKGNLDAFQMDISSDESVQSGKAYVEKRLAELNKELFAIVNNAGIQAKCFVDDMLDIADYKEAIEVNTYGPIRVTHAFKQMVKKAMGRIIFCTSSAVRFPTPAMGPYTASKFAASGYAEVLRHELRDFGVTVIVIEPGIFCTSMNEVSKFMEMLNGIWARDRLEIKEEYGEYFFSAGKRLWIKIRSQAATDLTPMTDAYFHAITAKHPYRCYTVGKDANIVFRPFSWLCPRVQEPVMSGIRWLVGAPIPAALDKGE